MADLHWLAIHWDGDRIFNATVSSGLQPWELAWTRKFRQMVGGGIRQANIMATARTVALNTMVNRLTEHHENAKVMAQGLMDLGIAMDMESVKPIWSFLKSPTRQAMPAPFSRT